MIAALLVVQCVTRRARASVPPEPEWVDDAESSGTFDYGDDVPEEVREDAEPFGVVHPAGALGVSVVGAVSRTAAPRQAQTAWMLGLVVDVPLGRVAAHRSPRPRRPSGDSGKSRPARAASAEEPAVSEGTAAPTEPTSDGTEPEADDGDVATSVGSPREPKLPTGATRAAPVRPAAASIAMPLTPSRLPTTNAASPTETGPSRSAASPTLRVPLEPSRVRELVAAAWRAAGVETDDVLAQMATRARGAALAPEVRLRARKSANAGARLVQADDIGRATTSDVAQTFLEARLTWKLDRVVFADEEVPLERLRIQRIELRRKIAVRVVELVVQWQRARRAAVDPSASDLERADAASSAAEARLALDICTAGASSGALPP